MSDTADGKGERRRAGQRLAVAEPIRDHELAAALDRLADGEIVGDRDVEGIAERVAGTEAWGAGVGRDCRFLLQGQRFGGERRASAVCGSRERDVGVAGRQIARVQRHPVAAAGRSSEGNRHRGAGDRVEHGLAQRVGLRHVETDDRTSGRAQRRVFDGIRADEDAVAGDVGRDPRRIGHNATILQRQRGQRAARAGRNGGDLDVGRDSLGDDDVSKRLPRGRGGRHGFRIDIVRTAYRFSVRHIDGLGQRDDRRVHHVILYRSFNDAGVGGRIGQFVVAELEAATRLNDQVRSAIGKRGVREVAELGRHLDRNGRLSLRDAAERQFEHDEFVAGPQAVSRCIDHNGIAVRILGERMNGVTVGVEGDDERRHWLAQIAGRNEGHAVVTVLARGGQQQIDIWPIAHLRRVVGERDVESNLIAQQDVAARGRNRGDRVRVREQAVVVVQGGRRQRDWPVDLAARDFERPVATQGRAARRVVRSAYRRARDARQFLDQRPAGRPRAYVASIQFNIRARVEIAAPGTQRIGHLRDVGTGKGLVAECELPRRAVGEDLDRVNLAHGCKRGTDSRDGVLAGRDDQYPRIDGQLREQLIAVFDAAVQHDQILWRSRRCRRHRSGRMGCGRRSGHAWLGGGCVLRRPGRVGRIGMMRVGGYGGRPIKQDARL